MIQSRRRRRHTYAQDVRPAQKWRTFIVPGVLIIMVSWGILTFLRSFSPAAHGSRVATVLHTDDRGRVQVTISGEDAPQRAESGLRLYDGDRVRTESSQASLRFFDGTTVILDAASSILLNEVVRGEEEASIALQVEAGSAWIETGTGMDIVRTIATSSASYDIPPRTQAIVGDNLYVFDSSGVGVSASVNLSSRTSVQVFVGEGQQLILDPLRIQDVKERGTDPYDLRTALDEGMRSSPLFLAAQKTIEEPVEVVEADIPAEEEGEPLIVEEPQDGALLAGSTVLVKGRVSSRVANVSVNGYTADISGQEFTKEIALPGEEEFSVEVQAEDRDGLVISEKTLSLQHDIQPPETPKVTFPLAASGETVGINEDTFEIVGTSSPDTTGIVVNGYQLQKFRPGGEWRYLVDPDLGNVRRGENTYEIVSLDRAGNRSAPTKITIAWKVQLLDPVGLDESSYIVPGSLRVIAPTSGDPYVTSTDEVLIEGETHEDTYTMSINGFTLTLYLPGKTTWNYIAKEEFGNYKPGVNRYTVVARDSEGKILDVLQYIIEYQ